MKIIPPDFMKYRRTDGSWYIIYRVDDTINHKFYIGSRKTDNLFDTYYGSPGKTNEYANILNECRSREHFDQLIFTVLKWTTKQERYNDEQEMLDGSICAECYNINRTPGNSSFTYDVGDKRNPFIRMKKEISMLNIEKNKEWAGIYHFVHPKYGEFKCSISDLIDNFKSRGVKIDRGMMNIIARCGSIRDGFPAEYKRSTPLRPSNKYYNWTCIDVIKAPFRQTKKAI